LSNNSNASSGIFINGKKQVIELLQRMDNVDKMNLLKNIKHKNPALAKELTEYCVTFQTIWELNDHDLKTLLGQVNSAILGLALSLTNQKNQRRALSLINREQAVKAFEIMQRDLSQNRNECLKAQDKILQTALNLQREKIINFY